MMAARSRVFASRPAYDRSRFRPGRARRVAQSASGSDRSRTRPRFRARPGPGSARRPPVRARRPPRRRRAGPARAAGSGGPARLGEDAIRKQHQLAAAERLAHRRGGPDRDAQETPRSSMSAVAIPGSGRRTSWSRGSQASTSCMVISAIFKSSDVRLESSDVSRAGG